MMKDKYGPYLYVVPKKACTICMTSFTTNNTVKL